MYSYLIEIIDDVTFKFILMLWHSHFAV